MASPSLASAAEAPLGRTLWPAVLAVTLAGIVAAFQIGKLPAALPALRADLGLSLISAGWVISTFTTVGLVSGMAWGFIADRLGHRRVLLAGMAVVALGTLLGSAAGSGTTLIATRLVEGAGYIAVLAAAPSIIAALSIERDRAMAMGIWAFYMPFGLAGMVVISPVFIGFAGWRGLWQLNAVFALAAMAFAAWATMRHTGLLPVPSPRSPATADRSGGDRPDMLSAMWRTLTAPGPPTLAVCFGAYSVIYLSVTSFLPTFLIERQGYAFDTAAYVVALAMLMNAPGCIVGAWLLRRGWSAARIIAVAYVGLLACALGIFAEDIDPVLRMTLAMILPFVGGFIPPIVLDRVVRHAASPMLVATCVGLIVQALALAQFIGPPILAALVEDAGTWQGAIWLNGPAGLIGLAAAWVLWRLERQG